MSKMLRERLYTFQQHNIDTKLREMHNNSFQKQLDCEVLPSPYDFKDTDFYSTVERDPILGGVVSVGFRYGHSLSIAYDRGGTVINHTAHAVQTIACDKERLAQGYYGAEGRMYNLRRAHSNQSADYDLVHGFLRNERMRLIGFDEGVDEETNRRFVEIKLGYTMTPQNPFWKGYPHNVSLGITHRLYEDGSREEIYSAKNHDQYEAAPFNTVTNTFFRIPHDGAIALNADKVLKATSHSVVRKEEISVAETYYDLREATIEQLIENVKSDEGIDDFFVLNSSTDPACIIVHGEDDEYMELHISSSEQQFAVVYDKELEKNRIVVRVYKNPPDEQRWHAMGMKLGGIEGAKMTQFANRTMINPGETKSITFYYSIVNPPQRTDEKYRNAIHFDIQGTASHETPANPVFFRFTKYDIPEVTGIAKRRYPLEALFSEAGYLYGEIFSNARNNDTCGLVLVAQGNFAVGYDTQWQLVGKRRALEWMWQTEGEQAVRDFINEMKLPPSRGGVKGTSYTIDDTLTHYPSTSQVRTSI